MLVKVRLASWKSSVTRCFGKGGRWMGRKVFWQFGISVMNTAPSPVAYHCGSTTICVCPTRGETFLLGVTVYTLWNLNSIDCHVAWNLSFPFFSFFYSFLITKLSYILLPSVFSNWSHCSRGYLTFILSIILQL